MALKFNPFENDGAPPKVPTTKAQFSRLRVFDDPPADPTTEPHPRPRRSEDDNTVGHDRKPSPPQNRKQTESEPDAKPEANSQQTESLPQPNRQPTASNPKPFGSKSEATHEQTGSETGSETDSKVVSTTSLLSLTGLQRAALLLIAQLSRKNRSKTSPPVANTHLAASLGTTPCTIKNALHRLQKKGFVTRIAYKNGRGGWSQYAVPDPVYADLERLQTESNWEAEPTAEPTAQPTATAPSSSRDHTILPTLVPSHPTQRIELHKKLAENLQVLIHRYNLEETYSIGSRDLLSVWHQGVFSGDVDAFLASVEHLAFYMGTPDGQKLNRNPKGFFMQELRNGYSGQPAGFKSWDERQAELKLKEAQQRLHRLRELERQQFNVDLEIWIAELDPQKRQAITRRAHTNDPNGIIAQLALRDQFIAETGCRNPFEDLEDAPADVA